MSAWWSRQRSRAATLEALVALLVATVLRRGVPMRRWQGLIGKASRATGAPGGERSTTDTWTAEHVTRAAARLPFGTTCLDQAVAGSLLLRRRGVEAEVVIGMNPDDPRAPLHAWLRGESGVVVGGDTMTDFVPVTSFRRREPSRTASP